MASPFSNFSILGSNDLPGWTPQGSIGRGGLLAPGQSSPPDDSFRVQGGLGLGGWSDWVQNNKILVGVILVAGYFLYKYSKRKRRSRKSR